MRPYAFGVPTLDELVRAHTDLDVDDVEWLHMLMADWQVIADLSFADLVLWLPDRERSGYWAAAQMRPTTGPTAYVDDLVGAFVPKGKRPLLDAALDGARIAREGDPEWRDDIPVRVEAIPVRRGDRVLGVIAPQHQPARGADAQPARALLPPVRKRPHADDRERALPVPGPALGPRRLAPCR